MTVAATGLSGARLASALNHSAALERLPLVTLYLTERCNSRCVTCDYWRHGRADMNLDAVRALLPDLSALETGTVLLSGGEPLLNPEWPLIAELLAAHDLRLWLLTSGLSLAKHARRAADLFDTITVSLDGTDRDTYAAIRGLDAFDKVCEGVRAATDAGAEVTVRVTLQRANYRQLPKFVELAHQLGAAQVSFLAVDVANPHAFGRTDDFAADVALSLEDLPVLEQLLSCLERDCAGDFQSMFVAESPQKLRRIHQYFAATLGEGQFPPVRCNAPEFSAVMDAKGYVSPCFFIPGPRGAATPPDLLSALSTEQMKGLRADIRAGKRAECARCVCSMWRDPADERGSIGPRWRRSAP